MKRKPTHTEKEPPTDSLSEYIGKLFHLTRNVKCRSGDVPEIHQVRDAGAFNDLRSPIEKLGYEWESELMLYAYKGKEESANAVEEPTEMLPLQPEDCLAMSTRMPMSDAESDDRVTMELAGDKIEKAAIKALRPFVGFCSRSTIELNMDFVAKLQQKFQSDPGKTPTKFKFAQHNDARIQNYWTMDENQHRPGNSEYSTLGFFPEPGIDARLRMPVYQCLGPGRQGNRRLVPHSAQAICPLVRATEVFACLAHLQGGSGVPYHTSLRRHGHVNRVDRPRDRRSGRGGFPFV